MNTEGQYSRTKTETKIDLESQNSDMIKHESSEILDENQSDRRHSDRKYNEYIGPHSEWVGVKRGDHRSLRVEKNVQYPVTHAETFH
jgi:hypothetical protein